MTAEKGGAKALPNPPSNIVKVPKKLERAMLSSLPACEYTALLSQQQQY